MRVSIDRGKFALFIRNWVGRVLKLCKLGAIRARNEIKPHAWLECKIKTALHYEKIHAGLDAQRIGEFHDYSCLIIFVKIYGSRGNVDLFSILQLLNIEGISSGKWAVLIIHKCFHIFDALHPKNRNFLFWNFPRISNSFAPFLE